MEADSKKDTCLIMKYTIQQLLTRYHTMTHFDTLKIYISGKHCEQDVFVKHECPRTGHFLRNVTFIFDR